MISDIRIIRQVVQLIADKRVARVTASSLEALEIVAEGAGREWVETLARNGYLVEIKGQNLREKPYAIVQSRFPLPSDRKSHKT